VKIYVIQYGDVNSNTTVTNLLKKVATPGADFYFAAPKPEDLQGVFNQIAKSLSALRIVK
jgi:hypothetical protein